MNDPEKYKGDNFNKTSSIQGVYDGTARIKVLVLLYYKDSLSPKGWSIVL